MADVLERNPAELSIGGDRLIRYPDLAKIGIPFSRQHLAALEARHEFPARIRLSERVIAWRLSEIESWLASKRS
jgi:predicted DNA-binding transcriptional regulator AlpA